ncbi:MmgE/PrpD family protein [Pantoea sp. 18069]|uniref:MmgE/PrpD family protein n=1 Tax=Pantoea sp. 18069 TaxID=2681415 RepID=UPI0013583032|nr:MmgE/PrpD family protein [Pantoea sp. 18069]
MIDREATSSLTLTQQIAAHWCARRFHDLPDHEVALVRQRLLDTLAAGMAGTQAPETLAVRAGVVAMYGSNLESPAPAAVWGLPLHLPVAQAALVNGTAAHARELDDFDGCGHTGAVVVPAACAVAQACGADGATVITAIAAGYDLAGRMLNAAGGYRPHNGLGWHSTATCGTFGAALAAAYVLQLDADRTAQALGIAGTYLGGVWAFMQDGAMTKRMHPGKAAETGVAAAYLAQAGMTGPRYILESEWGGFFKTYCGPHARPERVLEDLGTFNAITLTGIKPYACCRASHGAIDALLQLQQEHGLRADEIARIAVHCPAHTAKLVGSYRVDSVLDAQMSLPYALAVTAATGQANLPQFAPPRAQDPQIQRLMQAIALVPDLPADHIHGPLLQVECTDGRRLQAQVQFAKGAPQNPITDAELRAKAQSLMVPCLGQERFEAIDQAIAALPHCNDFRIFAALLRPAP